MTLMPNADETRSNGDKLRRSYAMQVPKWQKFQTTLVSSFANNTTSSKIGGGEDDIPNPYMRQYSHVYHQRLSLLGPKCWKSIENDDTIRLVRDRFSNTSAAETVDNNSTSNDISMKLEDDIGMNTVVQVDRVLELKENIRSVIVGTLVKETSVYSLLSLDDPANNDDSQSRNDQIHPQSTCCSTDQLYLEDESGRVALEFIVQNGSSDGESGLSSSFEKHQYCSGIVLGLLGTVGIDGTMIVEKVYPPTWDSTATTIRSADMVMSSRNSNGDSGCRTQPDPHLLLISGLQCGHGENSSMPREMLLSFLHGSLGAMEKAKTVSHVICCGGLIAPSTIEKKSYSNDVSSDVVAFTMNGCRDLDSFCYQVIYEMGIPLTILPGKDDPTTANWPQRPLHKSFLPISLGCMSGVKKMLSIVPNPFAAFYQFARTNENQEIETTEVQQHVIGTDGTNIQDLIQRLLVRRIERHQELEESNRAEKNSDVTILNQNDSDETAKANAAASYQPMSEIDALEYTLRWGHLCPTGPETVPTIPHGPENPDPMVLQDSLPSIYFAGNCSMFATRLIDASTSYTNRTTQPRKTRLICIPSFSSSGEAVMVNLRSLKVELLRFEE
jgi:DNA polymerase delta subunit 2